MAYHHKILLSAFLKRYARNQRGVTAIEYCLLVAGIALAIFTAVGVFGETLVGVYGDMNTTAQTAANPGS